MLNLCVIPGGEYIIGGHRYHIATFSLAETAVSVQQYAEFIHDDGYNKESLWTMMGWRWRLAQKQYMPAFWDDPRFNHPLQPVVGISWYEAVAYANWLKHETRQAWRLPTELEWEIAATQQVLNPQQINSVEKCLGRPWSVLGNGQKTTQGVLDLCGNVWEWTSSRWGRNWQTLEYPYPYQPDDGREDLSGSHARVIRGGSWFDPITCATPSHRGRYLPGSRASNISFRLAV
ncbi:MAG: hypothetical protein CUN56_01020 [Phototrophicales bacterium]|nr:MAG: hypothetical protein CUN56_01020 [Phototrophicales bacterium]RMG76736.1 MAG: hypothetical protein D6711_03190 [Chloroflexota bacterium]